MHWPGRDEGGCPKEEEQHYPGPVEKIQGMVRSWTLEWYIPHYKLGMNRYCVIARFHVQINL